MDLKFLETAFEQIEQVPRAEIPAVVGTLARLQAALLARLATPGSPPAPIASPAPATAKVALAAPRVLSVCEAARLLGKSRWWLYKRKREFVRVAYRTKKGHERYGFTPAGIEKWIAGHESDN